MKTTSYKLILTLILISGVVGEVKIIMRDGKQFFMPEAGE